MGFLIWFALGLILDFMFKIQSYILDQYFPDIFSSHINRMKKINMLIIYTMLYVIAWPIFIIVMLVLKLNKMEEDYEE